MSPKPGQNRRQGEASHSHYGCHDASAQSAGFYALAYDTPYGTVISYRGTDSLRGDGYHGGSDVRNGWVIGIGTLRDQSDQAIAFFDTVADAQRLELVTALQERATALRQEAA